ALRDYMRRDRARTKILRTSPFGLIEMTRQRMRPALKKSIFRDCPCCHGAGLVKTVESMSIEVMRMVLQAVQKQAVADILIKIA
ncbi:MAG: ribonuclease E/G, partial [Planctomycetia bacterium]|nr:ribonuclease E/G [Planctomycetia bacterium]